MTTAFKLLVLSAVAIVVFLGPMVWAMSQDTKEGFRGFTSTLIQWIFISLVIYGWAVSCVGSV